MEEPGAGTAGLDRQCLQCNCAATINRNLNIINSFGSVKADGMGGRATVEGERAAIVIVQLCPGRIKGPFGATGRCAVTNNNIRGTDGLRAEHYQTKDKQEDEA